jgi:hypothetical protein
VRCPDAAGAPPTDPGRRCRAAATLTGRTRREERERSASLQASESEGGAARGGGGGRARDRARELDRKGDKKCGGICISYEFSLFLSNSPLSASQTRARPLSPSSFLRQPLTRSTPSLPPPRRHPARPRPRPPAAPRPTTVAGRAAAAPARARAPRPAAGDPLGYVGRRAWRHYPDEDPANPWVEGFVVDYDAMTGQHTVLYDPNDAANQETTELLDFALAEDGSYVIGEPFEADFRGIAGSRRVASRPPAAAGPPPAAPPAKRRRSGVAVPPGAPFPEPWFGRALGEAAGEDLDLMLGLLEGREAELEAGLEALEAEAAAGPERAERAALEEKFRALCEKERGVMAALRRLRALEA